MSFPERGDVTDIDPAFFVGYLHRQGVTGTLKFDDPPVQRAIYFREGRILFSSSNAPEDQLGAILVTGGKISQAQFDAMVAALEPKQSIAAALGQGGHVSQRDIGDAARRKVEQIVAACCAQSTGRYDFERDILPKGALDLKLTSERVLVSAFELLEPSGFLNRILKSPMAVLSPSTEEIKDPELMRVRNSLDGVSTLADVGAAVGLPLAATEVRAAVLVVLGGASVVTSQIEEMSLPETGERLEGIPDAAALRGSETIAFGSMAADSESMTGASDGAFAPSPGSSEATMILDSSGLGAVMSSADTTLVMGSGVGPSPASESGAFRMGGVKREKASTQDLAAVKELLGAPSGPISAGPRPPAASIPAQRWEPRLSTEGRPTSRQKGIRQWLGRPLAQRALVLVGLSVVGLVAWSYFTGRRSQAALPAPPGVPAPRPSPSLDSPSPLTAAPAAPPTSGSVPPVPVATQQTPSLAIPTQAPATALPKPTPSYAVNVSTPTPPVTAPRAPPTLPPTAPSAKPATPAPAKALGGGFEALKVGRLAEAESLFLTEARSRASGFSIQLLVACAPTTVEKAVQNDPSNELFILPATIGGKACHRIMRGFFTSQAEAVSALAGLPAYYRAEGAKPQAIALDKILR